MFPSHLRNTHFTAKIPLAESVCLIFHIFRLSGARIEQQMREFDTAMSFEYEDMICRFKSLRKTMDASLPCPANEDGPSRTNEDRPLSKCRGRLEDAKKFSETNYTD